MTEIAETKIHLKLALLFLPAAFASYPFHEFGHWIVGEMLGNEMTYSLNYVSPKSGFYINANDNIYITSGGPAFTILQAIIFLLVIEKYKSMYAYPFAFFPMFMRFFSLVFGGFAKQDEARISALLEAGTYTVAIIVLLILFLVVLRCSRTLKIKLKENGYYFTISTVCILAVIGTYEFILK